MIYVTAKRNYLSSRKLKQKRVEYEELYMIFSQGIIAGPNEIGSQQFYECESFGKTPENPDPYYTRLCLGKKSFSITQEAIRDTYLTWEWWGFYQYWVDWKEKLWVLKHLFSWHPEPPSWLFKEDDPGEEL